MTDNNNSLIVISIHTLLERKEWERAQELLIADPSVSNTIGSSYEALPLLVAVMNKPPLTLVQSLIAANPGIKSRPVLYMNVIFVFLMTLSHNSLETP